MRREGLGVRWLLDAGGHPPPALDPALPAARSSGRKAGLTDAERAAALRSTASRRSLPGRMTLRFETAALSAAVLVQAARAAAARLA